MNQKAYKALEYYKIINMLTDKASSSMGKRNLPEAGAIHRY